MMKNKVRGYSILLLFFASIVSGCKILLLSLFYLVCTALVEGSAYNEIRRTKTGLIIRCVAGLLVLGGNVGTGGHRAGNAHRCRHLSPKPQ